MADFDKKLVTGEVLSTLAGKQKEYIDAQVAEAKQAADFSGLKLGQVGGSGKVITTISQTDGKVAATAVDLNATAVSATTVTGSTATNVQGILGDLGTKINTLDGAAVKTVNSGNGIEVTGSGNTISVSAKSPATDKFVAVTTDGIVSKAGTSGGTAIEEAIAAAVKTVDDKFGNYVTTGTLTSTLNDYVETSDFEEYKGEVTGAISSAVGALTASDITATAVAPGTATNVQGILTELRGAITTVDGKHTTIATTGKGITVSKSSTTNEYTINAVGVSGDKYVTVTDNGIGSVMDGGNTAIDNAIAKAVGDAKTELEGKIGAVAGAALKAEGGDGIVLGTNGANTTISVDLADDVEFLKISNTKLSDKGIKDAIKAVSDAAISVAAGNGIDVTGTGTTKTIAVKLANGTSEKYLEVTSDGLKSKGIDDAITGAIDSLINGGKGSDGIFNTLQEIQEWLGADENNKTKGLVDSINAAITNKADKTEVPVVTINTATKTIGVKANSTAPETTLTVFTADDLMGPEDAIAIYESIYK